MKFDMHFKNIKKKKKTYNSMVRFSKYVIMLICLVIVVTLGFTKFIANICL